MADSGMDEDKAFGRRLREVRCWRGLNLREAAGLAGLSFSFWAQVERSEKPVTKRSTLDAMASALRVHPAESTEQPWVSRDAGDAATKDALGVDPEIPVRPWPLIAADRQRLDTLSLAGDYLAQAGMAPVVLAELHGAYVRLPHQRPEVLRGLMRAYSRTLAIANLLDTRGLPTLAGLRVQSCAETVDHPVWLGYAMGSRGFATSRLNRTAHYHRSVAATESLTSQLDSSDALQACGLLHLSAAWAAEAPRHRGHPPGGGLSTGGTDGHRSPHLGEPVVRAHHRRDLEDQHRPGAVQTRPSSTSCQDSAPRAAACHRSPGRVLG